MANTVERCKKILTIRGKILLSDILTNQSQLNVHIRLVQETFEWLMETYYQSKLIVQISVCLVLAYLLLFSENGTHAVVLINQQNACLSYGLSNSVVSEGEGWLGIRGLKPDLSTKDGSINQRGLDLSGFSTVGYFVTLLFLWETTVNLYKMFGFQLNKQTFNGSYNNSNSHSQAQLERKLLDYERENEDYKQNLAKTKRELTNKSLEVKEYSDKLKQLTKKMVEKDGALLNKDKQIRAIGKVADEGKDRIDELKAHVLEKDCKITNLLKQLDHVREHLNEKSDSINELQRQIELIQGNDAITEATTGHTDPVESNVNVDANNINSEGESESLEINSNCKSYDINNFSEVMNESFHKIKVIPDTHCNTFLISAPIVNDNLTAHIDSINQHDISQTKLQHQPNKAINENERKINITARSPSPVLSFNGSGSPSFTAKKIPPNQSPQHVFLIQKKTIEIIELKRLLEEKELDYNMIIQQKDLTIGELQRQVQLHSSQIKTLDLTLNEKVSELEFVQKQLANANLLRAERDTLGFLDEIWGIDSPFPKPNSTVHSSNNSKTNKNVKVVSKSLDRLNINVDNDYIFASSISNTNSTSKSDESINSIYNNVLEGEFLEPEEECSNDVHSNYNHDNYDEYISLASGIDGTEKVEKDMPHRIGRVARDNNNNIPEYNDPYVRIRSNSLTISLNSNINAYNGPKVNNLYHSNSSSFTNSNIYPYNNIQSKTVPSMKSLSCIVDNMNSYLTSNFSFIRNESRHKEAMNSGHNSNNGGSLDMRYSSPNLSSNNSSIDVDVTPYPNHNTLFNESHGDFSNQMINNSNSNNSTRTNDLKFDSSCKLLNRPVRNDNQSNTNNSSPVSSPHLGSNITEEKKSLTLSILPLPVDAVPWHLSKHKIKNNKIHSKKNYVTSSPQLNETGPPAEVKINSNILTKKSSNIGEKVNVNQLNVAPLSKEVDKTVSNKVNEDCLNKRILTKENASLNSLPLDSNIMSILTTGSILPTPVNLAPIRKRKLGKK